MKAVHFTRYIIAAALFFGVFSGSAIFAHGEISINDNPEFASNRSENAVAAERTHEEENHQRPRWSSETRRYRLLPLRTLEYSEVEEILKPLLSPDGHLIRIASRNAALIYDQPEVIRKAENIIEEIDQTSVNIRITVAFDDTTESREAAAGITDGGIIITRERGGRVETFGDISITAGSRRSESLSTQFILTRDNRPASIWVGETVARPQWTFEYGIRRGWWRREVVYQDIGASLWVHPRVTADNQIMVEVYPKITLRGETPFSVQARELATQAVVADGGTIRLGGLDEEKRRAYQYLFGIGRVFDGRRLTISLSADIVEP